MAESGTIGDILPSGIAGKIEKLIEGNVPDYINFLDRELPDKGLVEGSEVYYDEITMPGDSKVAVNLQARP